MSEPWAQSWFWPVVIVTVGLPVLLVVCTEIMRALERRRSRAAGIIRLIRNFALPLGALLLLLSQVDDLELEVNWSRIIATIFGFVLILIVINLLNFALFATAERGSWRQRIPSIFIDIIKLVVIVVCFALLFQWVWGADVGGLFTALGVTSIVIGLALQNAAGSVVSGLLLLFEQPFKLGDWLETGSLRGRVVEVNWRAVHIDTGNGTHIVPTASLAGSSFTNLSRVTDFYEAQTDLSFSKTDAPTTWRRSSSRSRATFRCAFPTLPSPSPRAEPGSTGYRSPSPGPPTRVRRSRCWWAGCGSPRAGRGFISTTSRATGCRRPSATRRRRGASRRGCRSLLKTPRAWTSADASSGSAPERP
ncbi:mechanosensitive ion channel family protein [Microbacterium sp. NIBRBAC000506063]|uniref:mechanosensitive ion channel family protein n=1 Tax=Microbacterium sp. NIBRBAC000506063 TaxID=2734618 RepID=UPI001BB5D612|nr:mechanosensitive ion channel domain-containing protein [Microbacterium sp. NIBRBAC000506063]QTV80316.1 mechanosensitive ion channel [Microbacterium sp. NIBRBAC000506063]